ALHEAEEALKQAADVQRRRARIIDIAFLVTFVVVCVCVTLSGLLFWRSEQQRKVADDTLAAATNVIVKLQTQMDIDTEKENVRGVPEGCRPRECELMRNLGWTYRTGQGVAQDYAKAREWYEKAADKGDAIAMNTLGVFYHNGQGVTRDYAKA